jgi:hypothetical protein
VFASHRAWFTEQRSNEIASNELTQPGACYALLSVESGLMPGLFSMRPGPPQLSPDWSIWIMIVAVLFIVSVIMFYAYVS